LVENVDFVLLCGDLLSPSLAGPRGISMLLEAFDQLAERQIQVIWSAGAIDAAQYWPEAIPLPENVVRLPRGRATQVPITRGGETIAMVVGRSGEASAPLHVPSYRVDPADEFTIGVGYGRSDAESLSETRFDYWALGGVHHRQSFDDAATHGAHYCGTPQGRSLTESGAHGFLLVDVDADRTTRVHHVEVDSFRYCPQVLDSSELMRGVQIQQLLASRVSRLQNEHGNRHLLLGWELQPTNAEALEMVGDPHELLRWLRREFGSGSPAAWSLRLVVRPPQRYPQQWQEEDTILGDFLRAAGRHRKTSGRELNLLPITEEHAGLSASAASLLADAEGAERDRLLGEATLLGVELLRGGKPKV
jgi:hypothetical protein